MTDQTKHRAIDDMFSQRIEELLYSKTNEKIIVTGLLKKIIGGRRFKNALDIGAGPGEISGPIAESSEKLTIVEILPEYREILAKKFLNARIIIDSIDNVPLKNEFDFILISQVLYYFPENEWFGLIKRLYDALLPNGELFIILMNDSGDWWKTVDNYWGPLREHIRFDYIPLSKFKKTLARLGQLEEYPYSCQIIFDSEQKLIECIGREILQIKDEGVLNNYHNDFVKFASGFKRENGKMTLHSDAEIIVMKKV